MTTKHNNVAPVIPISLRVTETQLASLRGIAAESHRTVSQELRVAIDRHIADHEKEAA